MATSRIKIDTRSAYSRYTNQPQHSAGMGRWLKRAFNKWFRRNAKDPNFHCRRPFKG